MSQSSSRKETEHAICSFRMSEIGKEEPRPLCFLSADIFAEQKDGIVICVTNAAEAWSGDLKGRDLEGVLKAGGYLNWPSFCLDTKAALSSSSVQSDYIVTTEMTIKARKPALRVSWSKVVRNKSEEIGTILLAKSTNVAPITKKFLKLAVAKATVASLRSAELQVSVDALDTPFQSALEAAKHVVKDRQIEYINILSKTKLLLDAKNDFVDSISSTADELDVSR